MVVEFIETGMLLGVFVLSCTLIKWLRNSVSHESPDNKDSDSDDNSENSDDDSSDDDDSDNSDDSDDDSSDDDSGAEMVVILNSFKQYENCPLDTVIDNANNTGCSLRISCNRDTSYCIDVYIIKKDGVYIVECVPGINKISTIYLQKDKFI